MISARHRHGAVRPGLLAVLIGMFCAMGVAAQAAEQLRFGTAAQPPFIRGADGNPGALDVLYTAAFAKLGYSVEIVRLPAERSLMNANTGVDDGDALRVAGIEKRYKNLVRVSESTFTVEFVLIANKGAPEIHSWAELAGHSVGIINGWKIAENKLIGVADLMRAKNPDQLFGLLQRGRVEFIVFARQSGYRYIQSRKLTGLEIQRDTLARREMFIYLNKKHARLAVRLAGVLRGMKSSGEHAAILREYLPYSPALN